MRNAVLLGAALVCTTAIAVAASGAGAGPGQVLEGKRLFERETFGGNGRTCQTCHSAATGTVSPQDAEARFAKDPNDPLFVHDGSDDGLGHGTSRMRTDATVLMTIHMAANVQLADDPTARTVVLRRGIPTTLNTPALDPMLMVEGGNKMRTFIFNKGKSDEFILESPDPGRALITGVTAANDPTLEHVNAFKISPLRGIRHTAPYFHDNSAKTLEAVAAHYALFFNIVTGGVVNLTAQDQADIVAYMKLLD